MERKTLREAALVGLWEMPRLAKRAVQIQNKFQDLHDEIRLEPKDLATICAVDEQFFERRRTRSLPPVREKLANRTVRYRWGDVKEWLQHCPSYYAQETGKREAKKRR